MKNSRFTNIIDCCSRVQFNVDDQLVGYICIDSEQLCRFRFDVTKFGWRIMSATSIYNITNARFCDFNHLLRFSCASSILVIPEGNGQEPVAVVLHGYVGHLVGSCELVPVLGRELCTLLVPNVVTGVDCFRHVTLVA